MKKIAFLASVLMFLVTFPSTSFASGTLNLTQNSLNLSIGQTSSITASNTNGQVVNLISSNNSGNFNNSNTNNNINSVASVAISGNQITIFGMGLGTSNMHFCTSDNTCGDVFVTVGNNNGNNAGNNGQISFSQNNVSLNIGQAMTVSVYNPAGTIYIPTNSILSSVVSVYLTGNTINLTGLSAGSAMVTVCGSNAGCNNLYVTVTGNNTPISFSQNNLSLNVSQTTTVTAFNANSIYISNNSNSGVVTAQVFGNTITLTGINTGSSTITVCGTNSTCGSLFVTVNGNNNFGQISFSQASVSINLNQSQTVNIFANNSFNNSYYVSSNSNPSIASVSISGSTLNLYGMNYGTTNISVCQAQTLCGTVYVTVGYNNGNQGNLSFTATTLTQFVPNQYFTSQLNVTGGTAPYTYALNSGSLPTGFVLASTGQIFGTTSNNYSSTFTVRATDLYSRTVVSQNFILTPTGSVLGSNTYNNGTLVNENGTIYITYKNSKSPFASATAFSGLGFKFANVVIGSVQVLNYSGFTIGNANIGHPWGSWVLNGQTIYFVHDQGLIPVPSMDVFISNGGNLSNVVNANIYDMAKPIQSSMFLNDSRLR